MDLAATIDDTLSAFLKGRLPYEHLIRTLKDLSGGAPAHVALVDARLLEFVNGGRLPADMRAVIRAEIGAGVDPVAPAAPPVEDPPTVPRSWSPSGMAEPPARVGPPPNSDPTRQKIDDVVLSAVVADFHQYRHGRNVKSGKADVDGLDSALSDFRSFRFRRDASRAEAGEARPVAAEARAPAMSRAKIGNMLKDRFILDKELGRGGMGVVFQAVDRRRLEAQHQEPYVAVKVLTGDFRSHPDAFRVLEAEARKTQDLAHPNVVTVYDFDRDGDDVFMVMELLRGRPLDVVLNEAPDGVVSAADCATVMQGICAGLAHAHSRGVVHADLKPGNIFLLDNGAVKLLDFGIASASRSVGFNTDVLSAFTRSYASPQMIEGRSRVPNDDIYGLGCVAYSLHTGEHPFNRMSSLDAQVDNLSPRKPARIKPAQWEALRSALAFEADQRPSDAAAFRDIYFRRSFLQRLFG